MKQIIILLAFLTTSISAFVVKTSSQNVDRQTFNEAIPSLNCPPQPFIAKNEIQFLKTCNKVKSLKCISEFVSFKHYVETYYNKKLVNAELYYVNTTDKNITEILPFFTSENELREMNANCARQLHDTKKPILLPDKPYTPTYIRVIEGQYCLIVLLNNRYYMKEINPSYHLQKGPDTTRIDIRD